MTCGTPFGCTSSVSTQFLAGLAKSRRKKVHIELLVSLPNSHVLLQFLKSEE